VLVTPLRPPTIEEIKKLGIADIAIMTAASYSLRAKMRKYIQIDPYTVSDPFGDKDDFDYFVVIDGEVPSRIIAMNIKIKDPGSEIPWKEILNDRLAVLQMSKPDALLLKRELMPKDTNNFYPYRRSGKIVGFLMFAFQICGHN
jgi:5,10-methenyltetrahydromethanopterin hydrogenase